MGAFLCIFWGNFAFLEWKETFSSGKSFFFFFAYAHWSARFRYMTTSLKIVIFETKNLKNHKICEFKLFSSNEQRQITNFPTYLQQRKPFCKNIINWDIFRLSFLLGVLIWFCPFFGWPFLSFFFFFSEGTLKGFSIFRKNNNILCNPFLKLFRFYGNCFG